MAIESAWRMRLSRKGEAAPWAGFQPKKAKLDC